MVGLVTCFSLPYISRPSHTRSYMISEFVDGGCLMPDDKDGGAPLPLSLARQYMRQLLETVAYLHFQR